MLNLLELALNNNIIYISIIIVLIIIIILTIISIKKDRDKAINTRSTFEPAKTEEEKEKAKLELEKVVGEMQKSLENKDTLTDDIASYEQEQEEKAIISYQELVKAVKNNETGTPHNEIGMEVADSTSIEEPANENDDIIEILDENINSNIDTKEGIYEEKKFQTSEFISPIYGTNPQGDIKQSDDEDEVIDLDIKEEDEFLDSLKDFRKNL